MSLLFNNAWAQEGDIDDAEIVIELERKIELPTISRDYDNLEYKSQTFTPNQQFDYQTAKAFDVNLGPASHKVRVLTTKKDPLSKLYNSYLTAGFGNYGTTLLNYHYANKRNKEWRYGANLDHFASFNGPVENSGISDNTLSGFVSRYLNENEIGAKAYYDRSAIRYYGFDQNLVEDPLSNNVRQIYQNVGMSLIARNTENSNFNYNAAINISNYSASWLSETKLGYEAKLGYGIGEGKEIKLASMFSNDNLTILDSTYGRRIFKIEPGFQFSNDQLKVYGGILFAANKDTVLNEKNIHLYPAIRAAYDLNENVSFSLDVDGDLERNNYEMLTEENPFLDSSASVFDNNRKLGIEAGAQLALGTGFWLDLKSGFRSYENNYMFVRSRDSSRFLPEWNTGAFNRVFFALGIEYHWKKNLKAGASTTVNNYQLDDFDVASYKPIWELDLFANYKIRNKVELHLNGNVLGGMEAYDPLNDLSTTVPLILDLRLKADYNISDRVSVFLLANNLIAKKYQYYINYPKKGFNFIAGIDCSF